MWKEDRVTLLCPLLYILIQVDTLLSIQSLSYFVIFSLLFKVSFAEDLSKYPNVGTTEITKKYAHKLYLITGKYKNKMEIL